MLNNLLDNAYKEFTHSVHSVGARIVLWGSFKDSDHLQKNYFSARDKKHLSDARRSKKSLSDEEARQKRAVEIFSSMAQEYRDWARQNDKQPILREMLVSYCSAFEACLKNVALVFALAKNKKGDLQKQVFVPGDEFRRTLSDVKENWNASGKDAAVKDGVRSRAEHFFFCHIADVNPDVNLFKFLPMEAEAWRTCHAAFLARNAIVHQLGRPEKQIEIAGETLHPLWDMDLSTNQLIAVEKAFREIIFPIDPLSSL